MVSTSTNDITILVVDDEPGIRQMLQILFRREGFTVVTAPGVNRAVEAINQSPQPFPVIVTDLAMPDGAGLDVLAAAKARSQSTEVLMLTAFSTLENAIAAMRAGAYDFLQKPFASEELLNLVAKALEKQALIEENVRLRARVDKTSPADLVGRSQPMRARAELGK